MSHIQDLLLAQGISLLLAQETHLLLSSISEKFINPWKEKVVSITVTKHNYKENFVQ